jgi:hypothetical protein
MNMSHNRLIVFLLIKLETTRSFKDIIILFEVILFEEVKKAAS